MKELYKEVCDYITSHNGVSDNLYNGILLEVYEEYGSRQGIYKHI